LTDVHLDRAEREQPLHLGLLVIGPKVEMQAVLLDLGFGDGNEEEAGKPIGRGPDLVLVGGRDR
jgi:hypothetical protein